MKFRELAPIGNDAIEREGGLFDLIQAIPYLLASGRLPPLRVLNSVFETGSADAGMSAGVDWEPFTIDSQEYGELAAQCRQVNIATPKYPDWIKSQSDFLVWVYETDRGVPAKEHKVLADCANQARAELKQAIDSGASETEITELHLKVIETGQELVEYLDDQSNT